jgi:hypothetical protein
MSRHDERLDFVFGAPPEEPHREYAEFVKERPLSERIQGPTTWIERFMHALQLLSKRSARPPRELCERWVKRSDTELISWVALNRSAAWADPEGVIRAAEQLANTPEPGSGHDQR